MALNQDPQYTNLIEITLKICESLFGKQYIDDILAVEQRTQIDHTASSTSFQT